MKDIRIKYADNFDGIKDEWLQLEKHAVLYYFQSFLWLSKWFYNIGKNDKARPLIIAVYNNQTIVALFPFCIKKINKIFRTLTWMGGILTDYNAPVFSKELTAEDRELIIEHVLKELVSMKNIDLIFLKNVPDRLDDGSANPLINTMLISPCTHPEDKEIAPYIILSDWESCSAKLKTTLYSNTPYMKRRLMRMGNVEYGFAKNLNEVEEIMVNMFKQKAERFLDMGVKNILEDVNYQNFYLEASREMYKAGYLHLSWLRLNGIIIAADWGILFNGRLYFLVLYFEHKYRQLSLGRLKTENTVRWCCNNGIKIFDFCRGGEEYKNQWTDTYMTLYRFLTPMTLKGYVFNMFYRYIKPDLKRIIRYLRYSAAYRKARAALKRKSLRK